MKILFIIILSVFVSVGYSQIISANYSVDGKSATMTFKNGDSLEKVKVLNTQQAQPIEGLNANVLYYPSSERNKTYASASTSENLYEFEPGTYPEGDMLHDIEFTRDGRMFGILYQYSNQVYFYDSAYTLLSIVPVDNEPMDMCIVNNNAYVVCKGSKSLDKIDLSTFQITASFPIADNPCQIAVPPDESIAYIGFYSFEDGSVAAYDLQTQSQLYQLSEPLIIQNGWDGYIGRVFSRFFPFIISPDGNYLLCDRDSDAHPVLYNAPQGELIKTFEYESLKGAAFSDNSESLFILTASGMTGNCGLRKINLPDLSEVDSIIFTNDDYVNNTDLVLSSDEQKLLAINESASEVLHFNFITHTLTVKPDYDIFGICIKGNYNRQFGVVKSFGHYSVYNVNTGSKVSSTNVSMGAGAGFALSPVNGQMVFSDHGFNNWMMYGGEKYGRALLSPGGTISVNGTQTCGEDPEADSPTSSSITLDGKHLVACNRISKNITVQNIATGETESVFSLGKTTQVYRIPNTDILVFYGADENMVSLYDFNLSSVIAQFSVGNCIQVIASPNSDYLYMYGGAPPSGLLYKVSLLTSPPVVVAMLPVSYLPFTWTVLLWGENSNPHDSKFTISPDGRYIILAVDDQIAGSYINVVDVEKMEIVKSLTGISTNVVACAFSSDSQRACLLTYDKNLIILGLDGTSTYVQTNVNIPEVGISVVYQPFEELFYVMYVKDQILKLNPADGSIVGNIWTNNNFSWELFLDNGNLPVICQNMSIWKDGVTYALPNATISSSFIPEWNALLANVPGPDRVFVLGNLFVGMNAAEFSHQEIKCIPNPAIESVDIQLPAGAERFEIFDSYGRLVASKTNVTATYTLNVHGYSAGLYLIKSYSNGKFSFGRMIVAQ